ncbi:hypothetical protein ATANTOWER_006438, partial [Ataeniobius toweri]|nr:hypothetical protein [Ataeniobius toweri]
KCIYFLFPFPYTCLSSFYISSSLFFLYRMHFSFIMQMKRAAFLLQLLYYWSINRKEEDPCAGRECVPIQGLDPSKAVLVGRLRHSTARKGCQMRPTNVSFVCPV